MATARKITDSAGTSAVAVGSMGGGSGPLGTLAKKPGLLRCSAPSASTALARHFQWGGRDPGTAFVMADRCRASSCLHWRSTRADEAKIPRLGARRKARKRWPGRTAWADCVRARAWGRPRYPAPSPPGPDNRDRWAVGAGRPLARPEEPPPHPRQPIGSHQEAIHPVADGRSTGVLIGDSNMRALLFHSPPGAARFRRLLAF